MKKFPLLLLPLLLAGCEQPVDPAAIKIHFGGDKILPQDRIWIAQDHPLENELKAEPGEKIDLHFTIANTVRDEVFVRFDESTAYVATQIAFMPGDAFGSLIPENAPVVNPAANAGSYRRLLSAPKGVNSAGPERSLAVTLPVNLPRFDWDHVEVKVIFSIRGYTRDTRGEFRDTISKTFTIQRRNAATRPATTLPAPRPGNGIFLRPGTNPATLPGKS